MTSIKHFAQRYYGMSREFKDNTECVLNRALCKTGLDRINAKYMECKREADSLRALPQLNSFQAQRLAGLEKTIANLQGTLKNAAQKTR